MAEMDPSTSVRADLSIKASEDVVKIIESSLIPEVKRAVTERSKVDLVSDGDTLRMHIEASDTSALRAALNSYLRWIVAILDVVGSLGCSPKNQ